MLRENLDAQLIVAWKDKVASSDALEALLYLVGHAATSGSWICHPQWKGYIPDFRYYQDQSNEWFFSFVPAREWLLFYFRPSALRTRRFDPVQLLKYLDGAEEKRGEIQFRVRTLSQAIRVVEVIENGNSA